MVEARRFVFRALVTLDPDPSARLSRPAARQYPSHTRSLVILADPLWAGCGPARYLAAEIWRDDEAALRPGDQVLVTVRVSDDHARDYLDVGQRFSLWSGGQVGRGIVYRRV